MAATGPSLTEEVAEKCKGKKIVAVNDAYRLMPYADVLYACDAAWWDVHQGCPEFHGEKWSSHGSQEHNNKFPAAEKYGLSLIQGDSKEGFSLNPGVIHYGSNSGFQAINLAILFGCKRIILVGFDMRTNGKKHFFGDHPKGLINCGNYERFIPAFERAAKKLPSDISIINCTPGSALTCFQTADLDDALSG